ncbi:hypothetical protein [Shewanella gelidii]|uniref:Uncharacterized protein n=1 Tax=Shewanella gelidii TaxID=1642821 RepID=A0A917JWC1_9GAMM|nr:hypothetical protein [Shewanella gelidii]MCL1099703.1 hypothetical protein [Shewanella gelidii]GGI89269.1 hypothetical protein GCM10009332_28330 [Shewanella gelidii]
MLKSLFLSLALREIDKGGTRSYSAISAVSTLSFFMLLNLWSILLITEIFLGSVFAEINNFLFSQKHYIASAVILYFIVAITVYYRYKNLDLVSLAKQHPNGIGRFIIYGAFSGIVFIYALFLHI